MRTKQHSDVVMDKLSRVWEKPPNHVLPTTNRFGVTAAKWFYPSENDDRFRIQPIEEYRIVINRAPLKRHELWSDATLKRSDVTCVDAIRIARPGESGWGVVNGDIIGFSHAYIPSAALNMLTDGLYRTSGQVVLRDPLFNSSDKLIAALLDALVDDNIGIDNTLYVEHLTLGLLSSLTHRYADNQGSVYRVGRLSPTRSRAVIDYMKASVNQDVSLVELASAANLSVYHFARAFKKTFGVSAYRYFNDMRMAKAKSLMLDRSLDLMQIALALGYSNHSAFSTAFRRVTGSSPAKWRNDQARVNSK
jgi:AraC-like DNA-binding protein